MNGEFILNPHNATNSFDVTILYNDVAGKKRESVVQMGKDGIKLVRHYKTD